MTKQELINWHNTEWWPRYQEFVKTPYQTQWGPGGKGESLKKILQLNPSEQLRNEMIAALIEQTRHRKKLYEKLGSKQAYEEYTSKQARGGESIYKNRHSRTYVHNMGWIDEIPSIMEHPVATGKKKCFCGKDVHGPRFDYCTEHLPKLRAIK